MSNRGVMPVFSDGEHIRGMPIDSDVLLKIKSQIGNDLAIITPDGEGFKFLGKTHDLTIPPSSFPFLRSLLHKETVTTKRNHKNGKDLISTYGQLKDFSGKIVGLLVVPLDITEDVSNAKDTMIRIICIASVILIASIINLLIFFQRMVNRPINSLKQILAQASKGDLNQRLEITQLTGKDEKNKNEFVELGRYVCDLLHSIREMVQAINDNSGELNNSATSLNKVSSELSGETKGTASRIESVAQAASEMSNRMDSVATATEEAATNVRDMTERTEGINETVAEIQRSTGSARTITGQAVSEAHEISGKMNELGSAAKDIGKVTEAITEISEQTNLLALNATIEAARAGEAGKGFAVVANEIKDLARQTADATGEISSRIQGIQKSTGVAVDGIEKISEIIQNIDVIVIDIAGSLDGQGEDLGELTGSIQQLGEVVSGVAENIDKSSSVAHEITTDVAEVNNATVELSRAGEAGKGFAVVANEIKDLARQTAGATSEIKEQMKIYKTQLRKPSLKLKKSLQVSTVSTK